MAGEVELQGKDKSSEALIAQILCADATEEKTDTPKRRTSSRIAVAKHTTHLGDALSGTIFGESLQSAKQNAHLATLRANTQKALSY